MPIFFAMLSEKEVLILNKFLPKFGRNPDDIYSKFPSGRRTMILPGERLSDFIVQKEVPRELPDLFDHA